MKRKNALQRVATKAVTVFWGLCIHRNLSAQ
jgi:hypothetical protein